METLINTNERIFQVRDFEGETTLCNLKSFSIAKSGELLINGNPVKSVKHYWNDEFKRFSKKDVKEMIKAHTPKQEAKTVDFTRINNDVNGNPRYVCHFLNIADDYTEALKKARTIGGKKFHNKQYGGGIVFQSYNIKDLERSIIELNK